LLISLDFGMRGVDYRAPLTGITLIVALPFRHEREATQALARVGRYKEPCARYLLDGIELIDELQCAAYIAGLLNHSKSRKKVQAKKATNLNRKVAATATTTSATATAEKKKKNNGSNMTRTRQAALI
jgi:hypothetical protein